MTKDKYMIESLYIATPSIIKQVKGQFIRGKRPNEPQRVVQTAVFETLPRTIVTYGLPSPYEDINKNPNKYYDARQIETFGISIEDQTKRYVCLTPDDLIPFKHFISNITCAQAPTLTFFQRSFWKKQKSKPTQTIKRIYTAEELQEISQTLQTPYHPKTLIKRYSTIKQNPTLKVINGSVVKTSRKYAGINDPNQIDTF